MRAVKVLVVLMGVLIVAGFAALVAGLVMGVDGEPPAIAGRVALPPGGRLEGVSATADHIVLDVRLPDGTAQLLLIDPDSGQPVGEIGIDNSQE